MRTVLIHNKAHVIARRPDRADAATQNFSLWLWIASRAKLACNDVYRGCNFEHALHKTLRVNVNLNAHFRRFVDPRHPYLDGLLNIYVFLRSDQKAISVPPS